MPFPASQKTSLIFLQGMIILFFAKECFCSRTDSVSKHRIEPNLPRPIPPPSRFPANSERVQLLRPPAVDPAAPSQRPAFAPPQAPGGPQAPGAPRPPAIGPPASFQTASTSTSSSTSTSTTPPSTQTPKSNMTYSQMTAEVAAAIRRTGKHWVARENPTFAHRHDFSGLLGAKVVSPEPVPVAGVSWVPGHGLGYQPRLSYGHRLKTRRIPPLRARSIDDIDYEDRESRFTHDKIPETYDVRSDYPQCKSIDSIRYPFGCNGCWAFGATSVMTDRHCIYNYAKTGQLYLSTFEVLSCVTDARGCNGGMEWDAFRYWVTQGIVTGGTAYKAANQPDGCLPLPIDINNRKNLTCPTACSNTNYSKRLEDDKTYGGDYYHWWFPSVETIQREIFVYGPVSAFFRVYEDFFSYGSGVYEYVYGEFKGTHVIKIIGWGKQDGIDYWLVVNSWGKEFGENGFFKIRRGVNMCQIESRIGGVLPKEGIEK